MYGAILGDMIGSSYEVHNPKRKDVMLFTPSSHFTDDTVMTIAVGKALITYDETGDLAAFRRAVVKQMVSFGDRYPHCGYGTLFARWLDSPDHLPYGSFGNGSAMRVSAVGFYAASLQEAERLAEASAAVTHNHPEGIRGACALAAGIYLARIGKSKEAIRAYIQEKYYDLDFTLEEIRPGFSFADTCAATVPPAIVAFLSSDGFEDAIRNALSLGGDSDTLACMTGGLAEAYYGVPEALLERGLALLDEELQDEVDECRAYFA